MASDLILPVKKYTNDGGLAARCPHCKKIVSLPGNRPGEILGEMFTHDNDPKCGGQFEITTSARFVDAV